MKTHLALLFSIVAGGCVGEPEDTPGPVGPDPNSPRVLEGLAALYTFAEGDGLVIHDVSGVEPALDLNVDNLVTNKWVKEGGMEIVGPAVITSPDVAEKLFVACVQANAVSLEAWVQPTNITQSSTLFSYSKANERNVTLSQTTNRYAASILASSPDPMMKDGAIQSMQTPMNMAAVAPQHIVYTRDANGAAIYLNGVDTKPAPTGPPPNPPPPPPPTTDLKVWSPITQLVIGNESNGGKPWLGTIYLAAVYCKKLTPAEITKNFTAGY